MEGAPVVIVGRPQHAVRPGSMIADKYRVERELGRGGFGIVVSAIHLQLDQRVAIKILTAGEGGEAEWQEDAARFRREGQATAALRSEHVVRILDVDVLESGNPYMVMEYLEGETLHALLHTREPLPVAEAVDHVVQVLAALGEAHAAGIVHRDLKPANVFVTRGAGDTPVVKVLDFGVSKVGAHSAIDRVTGAPPPITKTGALIGTVAYMAPEQMLDAKRVDARADLWSVAIILRAAHEADAFRPAERFDARDDDADEAAHDALEPAAGRAAQARCDPHALPAEAAREALFDGGGAGGGAGALHDAAGAGGAGFAAPRRPAHGSGGARREGEPKDRGRAARRRAAPSDRDRDRDRPAGRDRRAARPRGGGAPRAAHGGAAARSALERERKRSPAEQKGVSTLPAIGPPC